MKLISLFALLGLFDLASSFIASGRYHRKIISTAPLAITSIQARSTQLAMSTTAESEPAATKGTKKEEIAIPTYLPSDMGIDYGKKYCVEDNIFTTRYLLVDW